MQDSRSFSNVLYQPFGPTRGGTWGNGTVHVREYDTDGRITHLDSAGLKTYSYDEAFRITGITDSTDPALSRTYGYDPLDRLTSAVGTTINQGWSYDANGNRLGESGSAPSTYTISGSSNRISAVTGALNRTYTHDAAGNITGDGTVSFSYDDAGRMVSAVTAGGNATFSLNALGQRVKKTAPGGTTYFVYDEAGHLLGEYNGSGVIKQEIIWLDDLPVVVLRRDASGNYNPYYVHTDHLNTPRQISRPNNNVVRWRWDADPFGVGAADADPDGDTLQFIFNLRFPGQYYDAETGLSYNYMRDYDPQTGRYLQSDPIGLRGGLNPYTYVLNNPLQVIDQLGLYGTQSCAYYDQACTANGGSYECNVATALCPQFPNNDDPTGNGDPVGNWSECARQCLQEKHKDRMRYPQQCSDENNISPRDNTEDHGSCWLGCMRNPENPYNPSGLDLPDGRPSLY